MVKGTLSRDLEMGEQILRIGITGANVNIDKLELICTAPNAIDTVVDDSDAHFQGATYNLMGVKVDDSYRGIVIRNGKKILLK